MNINDGMTESVRDNIANWAKDFRVQSFLLVMISAICSLFLVDVTPVNGGQGWDGSLYYQMILDWSNGKMGSGVIPYRLMRAVAFMPQIFLCTISEWASLHLVLISKCFAVMWATLGGWFSILACHRLGKINTKVSKVGALLLLACYLMSYAVFTMPAHYPLLSDHISLFISGFSLWLWTGKECLFKNIGLGLLAALSLFIMPFVSLVPMALFMFPALGSTSYTTMNKVFLPKINYTYFVMGLWMVSLGISAYFMHLALKMPDALLLGTRGVSGYTQCLIDIKSFSAVITTVVLSWSLLLLLILGFRLLPRVSWMRFLLIFLFLLPSILILWILPDWAHGSGGFDLLSELKMRPLYAPGIQVVSLFGFFGPIGFIGAWALTMLVLMQKFKLSDAPTLIAAFFLVMLTLNMEGRQSVVVLPVFLFLGVLVFKDLLLVCGLSVLFTFALGTIGWPVAENVAIAIQTGGDMLNYRFQAYFGRQGPWMSLETITLLYANAIMYVFSIGFVFMINFFSRSDT